MPERRGRKLQRNADSDNSTRKPRRSNADRDNELTGRNRYRHRALKEAVIISELEAMEEEYSY